MGGAEFGGGLIGPETFICNGGGWFTGGGGTDVFAGGKTEGNDEFPWENVFV